MTMSDQIPTAQLISIGEVQRLVQERRRHPRAAARSEMGSMAPRHTSQVRRLLVEHRGTPPSGPEAA